MCCCCGFFLMRFYPLALYGPGQKDVYFTTWPVFILMLRKTRQNHFGVGFPRPWVEGRSVFKIGLENNRNNRKVNRNKYPEVKKKLERETKLVYGRRAKKPRR